MRCEYPKCNRERRVHPMFLSTLEGSGYVNLCPIHALEVRNLQCGLPSGTPFQGEIAQDEYEKALEEEEASDDKRREL